MVYVYDHRPKERRRRLFFSLGSCRSYRNRSRKIDSLFRCVSCRYTSMYRKYRYNRHLHTCVHDLRNTRSLKTSYLHSIGTTIVKWHNCKTRTPNRILVANIMITVITSSNWYFTSVIRVLQTLKLRRIFNHNFWAWVQNRSRTIDQIFLTNTSKNHP